MLTFKKMKSQAKVVYQGKFKIEGLY
jgi:hypothetical protein